MHHGGGPRGQSGCNASDRVCTISVANCAIGDPGELVIDRQRDVDILWKLERGASQYVFESNGIEIRDGGGQFSAPVVEQDGMVIRVRDANSLPGEHRYKYTIRVKMRGGASCPALDPVIVNKG